ncbi:MAG: hypothetical protein WA656_11860, partial [Pseudolabrys sp.]
GLLSQQPRYGTFDAAEWAPSTASKADIKTLSGEPLLERGPAPDCLKHGNHQSLRLPARLIGPDGS